MFGVCACVCFIFHVVCRVVVLSCVVCVLLLLCCCFVCVMFSCVCVVACLLLYSCKAPRRGKTTSLCFPIFVCVSLFYVGIFYLVKSVVFVVCVCFPHGVDRGFVLSWFVFCCCCFVCCFVCVLVLCVCVVACLFIYSCKTPPDMGKRLLCFIYDCLCVVVLVLCWYYVFMWFKVLCCVCLCSVLLVVFSCCRVFVVVVVVVLLLCVCVMFSCVCVVACLSLYSCKTPRHGKTTSLFYLFVLCVVVLV